MTKAMKGMIKKDFLFNWKACALMAAILMGACLIEGADCLLKGSPPAMDRKDYMILLWLFAMTGSLPVNQSFQRENSVSTRAYFRSLPVTAKEVFLANLAASVLYGTVMFSSAMAITCLFGYPFYPGVFFIGEAVNLFVAAGYICLFYTVGFDAAQVFYLGLVVLGVILFGYMGLEEAGYRYLMMLAEPGRAALVSAGFGAAAAGMMGILIKQKRRI